MTREDFIGLMPQGLKAMAIDAVEELTAKCIFEGCEEIDEVEDTINAAIWRVDDDFNNIYYRMQDVVKAHYPEHNAANLIRMFLTDVVCGTLNIQ